jgi:hypothetical protein
LLFRSFLSVRWIRALEQAGAFFRKYPKLPIFTIYSDFAAWADLTRNRG